MSNECENLIYVIGNKEFISKMVELVKSVDKDWGRRGLAFDLTRLFLAQKISPKWMREKKIQDIEPEGQTGVSKTGALNGKLRSCPLFLLSYTKLKRWKDSSCPILKVLRVEG